MCGGGGFCLRGATNTDVGRERRCLPCCANRGALHVGIVNPVLLDHFGGTGGELVGGGVDEEGLSNLVLVDYVFDPPSRQFL